MSSIRKRFAIIGLVFAGLILIASAIMLIYSKSYLFFTEEVASSPIASDWNGKWLREGSTNFSSSTLDIKDAAASGTLFIIDQVEGYGPDYVISSLPNDQGGRTVSDPRPASVRIEGSHLSFDIPEDDSSPGARCTGNFNMSQDRITLEVKTDCGDYDGVYKKDGTPFIVTMKNSKIFTDYPDQYEDFQKLVGSSISEFDGDLQDQEYSNDPSSQAWLGNIPVLKRSMKEIGAEALIQFRTDSGGNTAATIPSMGTVLLGQHGEIWAAVTYYNEKKDRTELLYFTNSDVWKKKIPDAIGTWRTDACYDSDGNCPVVYENPNGADLIKN